MSTYDDRDVLAAIAATSKTSGFDAVKLRDAGYLIAVEYDGDLDDNVDRLIKRGQLEAATITDSEGQLLGQYDTPPVVRLTDVGWFELWRR